MGAALLTVYPRWRGELTPQGLTRNRQAGLSPLARGTLRERIAARLRKRFIPAGAGNSVAVLSRFSLKPVYPRWRGELAAPERQTPICCGLSPLARGTL